MSSTATTTATAEGMTLHAAQPSDDKPTMGSINYIPHDRVPKASPHNFHLPEIAEFSDRRLLPLHNMRPLPSLPQLPTESFSNHPTLSTHGFTALHHPTTLNSSPYTSDSWKDPSLLKSFYVPDTAAMLKSLTGCTTVVTEALLIRSALWTESDALATHGGHGETTTPTLSASEQQRQKQLSDLETGFPQFIGFNPDVGGASPAPKPHVDYAPSGARLHIRSYHPELIEASKGIIEAEDHLTSSGKSLKEHYCSSSGPRWALFSIWRPLKPVLRDPLALLDPRTCKPEDYLQVVVKTPYLGDPAKDGQTHDTDSFLARWSEGQQWNWIEGQMPEEVLVIGLWDSEAEGRGNGCLGVSGGGTLHSSVDLVGQESVREARESLELRCLCVWD